MSATGASAPLLDARGLVKTYRGRKVLAEVSVKVRGGEIIGLLGPNGAGKTTTFHILSGMVPPDAGSISMRGAEVTSLPVERRLGLGIGILPQESSVFASLTVRDNLRAVLQIQGRSRRRTEEVADELLERLDIAHVADQRADELSGGERRRVEIARAMVSEPSLLMLDEPFTAIDPIMVAELQLLIAGLREKEGIAFLISDHNVRETLSVCDRAYIMHNGKVLAEGTPEEVAGDRTVREHYLGAGFTL